MLNDKHLQLVQANKENIFQLMTWFPNEHSTLSWSGTHFRYPFSKQSFVEDIKLNELASYLLIDDNGQLYAFGQFYQRLNRCHLGRLVVAPAMRGQGLIKVLLSQLSQKGASVLQLNELSLFVFKDNVAAINAYLKFGFQISEYPEEIGLPQCLYMTKTK